MKLNLSSGLAVLGLVAVLLGGLFGATGLSDAQSETNADDFLGGVTLEGHVNVLGTSLRQDFDSGDSADTSSVDVSSAELVMTVSSHENVDATVVWLLEEGLNSGGPNDGFAVDQAFVTLGGNQRVLSEGKGRESLSRSPWYLRAGKFYVPFGGNLEYHTFDVISEPQTLGLAETLESSVMLGFTPGDRLDVYAGAYGGAGPDDNGEETVDNVYAGAEVKYPAGNLAVQWTNNINNSIALGDENTGELSAGEDAVSGVAAYGGVDLGPAQLQVEYVSALNDYRQGSFSDRTPTAIASELTIGDLATPGRRPVDVTLVYGVTDDWFDHPETTQGAVVDVGLMDSVTGSLEFINRKYDPTLSGRLGEENLVSFRLATDFGTVLGQ